MLMPSQPSTTAIAAAPTHACPQSDWQRAGRRGPRAGRLPEALALGGQLPGTEGQRQDLDAFRGPRSGHRPATLAGVPSEDAGEGRGPNGTTERSLRRDLAQIPTGSGARSPPGPPARAVQDPRPPPLLLPDERGGSRTLLPAARHCEGAHEARTKEAAQSP